MCLKIQEHFWCLGRKLIHSLNQGASQFTIKELKKKTSRDRKWLPRIHLISCWGVKLSLTKDFCQLLFFWLEFEFLSCHDWSCWFLSTFELLNFFTVWVFEICQTFSWILSQFRFWVLLQFKFWVFQFCNSLSFWVFHNLSFWVLSHFNFLSFVPI